MAVNAFDANILAACGQLVVGRPGLAHLVIGLNNCVLLKGELFMAVCFWLWFSSAPGRRERREIIVGTLLGAFIAIVVGRELAAHLPYRVRPIFDTALGLPQALLTDNSSIRNWSSFPSDHAVLFSAVAMGFWRISKRLGAAAQVYWLLIVGAPRVFLGLHYPTDVLAGGVIGTAVGWFACALPVRKRAAALVFSWKARHPASFYAGVFLVLAEIGTMFSDVRSVLAAVATYTGLAGQ